MQLTSEETNTTPPTLLPWTTMQPRGLWEKVQGTNVAAPWLYPTPMSFLEDRSELGHKVAQAHAGCLRDPEMYLNSGEGPGQAPGLRVSRWR